MVVRDLLQEIWELGIPGTAFRAIWELASRGRLMTLKRAKYLSPEIVANAAATMHPLPLANPDQIAQWFSADADLRSVAEDAARGRIRAFRRWTANYGQPIQWTRDPVSGVEWPAVHWSRALARGDVADVKFVWEIGRFLHAYPMARAAVFHRDQAPALAVALRGQIESFLAENPIPTGVHWASGLEAALRVISLSFAHHVLTSIRVWGPAESELIARLVLESAHHIDDWLAFSRYAAYNDHLIGETVALLTAATMFPDYARSAHWRETARAILTAERRRQFFMLGGHFTYSHNYHRAVIEFYTWAMMLGDAPKPWREVMALSADHLFAQQNPVDGRVPNYGSNDGGEPMPLSSSDFPDFRPALQAASVLARGKRLYDAGPWDETTSWLTGAKAETFGSAPVRRVSASFPESGLHTMRGRDESNFAVFHCGSVKERFAQIDMLHLDVWWRGRNVLADGGTFLYNGAPQWQQHFLRTASHNTIMVDGVDQMLHLRKFKVVYWTKAHLINFEDRGEIAVAAGEHFGYQRRPGHVVHRRSIAFAKDDLWIVVDTLQGEESHSFRLHWLGGNFPWTFNADEARLEMSTPDPFSVTLRNDRGQPLPATAVAGQEDPPRGWISRYYGEKTPAPSLAAEMTSQLPCTVISVLSAGTPRIDVAGREWSVATDSNLQLRFTIAHGVIELV
jgi:asparagine synthase (glutamine-hydrolysing)